MDIIDSGNWQVAPVKGVIFNFLTFARLGWHPHE